MTKTQQQQFNMWWDLLKKPGDVVVMNLEELRQWSEKVWDKALTMQKLFKPAKEIKFNINYKVKIKINPTGELILRNYYHNLNLDPPKIDKDENGYSTFQMWELFKYFGSSVDLGCQNPFETTVLLDDNNLE